MFEKSGLHLSTFFLRWLVHDDSDGPRMLLNEKFSLDIQELLRKYRKHNCLFRMMDSRWS